MGVSDEIISRGHDDLVVLELRDVVAGTATGVRLAWQMEMAQWYV